MAVGGRKSGNFLCPRKVYKKRTIMQKICGQIVDRTSLNSEKIRNRTSLKYLAFLINKIACSTYVVVEFYFETHVLGTR